MTSEREDKDRARLIDLHLEGVVLGSCLIRPELLATADISTTDFYAEGNREVWAAMVAVAAEGEPVDTATVQGKLVERGKLEQAGGFAYLLQLTDTIPVVPLPTLRLKRLARQRALKSALVKLHTRLGTADADREFARVDRAREELEALTRPEKLVELPDIADALEGLNFDPRRFATSLPSLDAALRGGGFPPESWIVLSGAPGAAKTTISVWLAHGLARQGAEVVYLAADEGVKAVLVRIGQIEGFSRDAMESPHPAARKALASKLRKDGLRLRVVDLADLELTLEDAGAFLDRTAGDRVRVLVVDSLQEVPCRAAADARDEYEKTNAVVAVCKRLKRRGYIVIGISEMSRAGYRNGGGAADTVGLASAKGSGKIEYGAELLCTLNRARDVPGPVAVDIKVEKSRLGNDHPTVRVQIDQDRASIREIDAPNLEVERRVRVDERAAREQSRVLATLAKHSGLRSKDAVWRAAGGNRTATFRALSELIEVGTVALVDRTYQIVKPYQASYPNDNE